MATIGDRLSAGVHIFPDLRRFGPDTAKGVEKVTKSLKPEVTVTARLNDLAARLGFKDLIAQRDDLNKKAASIAVDVKDKAAQARLLDITARLDKLNAKKIDPEIDLAGAARVSAQLLRLDAQLDQIGRKHETATVDVKTDTSALGKLGGKLGGWSGSWLALLPGLIPVAAGLVPAIAAIGTSFAGAGITAGLFGKTVTSVLSSAGQDSSALAQLQASNSKQSAALQSSQELQLAALRQKIAQATTAKQKQALEAQLKNLEAQQARQQGALSKSQQQQLATLEKGWSGSYRQVVTLTGQIKDQWKTVSRAVAAPVLVPWLDVAQKALGHLKPLVQPVADLFRSWGQDLDRYFASGKGSAEITKIATELGNFGAIQLGSIVTFLRDLGSGVANLARDVTGHGVDFYSFGVHLQAWGAAFKSWSQSGQARQDVNKFLDWLHANGGKVSDLLGAIAQVLPGLATGISAAGQLELQALTAFLNLVASLPPGVAKPVEAVAAAALILAKLPGGGKVIKFTVDAVLGKGLAGAAGGAAGGAAAGAEGGLIAGLLGKGMKVAIRGGIAFAAVDILLNVIPSGPANPKDKAPFGLPQSFETPFGMPGPKDPKSANNWLTSWAPYERFFTKTLPGWIATGGGKISRSFTEVGQASDVTKAKLGLFANLAQDQVNKALISSGTHADYLRINHLGPLGSKIDSVTHQTGIMQGVISNPAPTSAGGTHADTFKNRNLEPLRSKIQAVDRQTQLMQGTINNLHGKTIDVGVHGSGSGGAKVTVQSVGGGAFAGKLVAISNRAAGGFISGGTPGQDSVAAMLMPGEVVIPTSMVRAGAVDHLRGRLPGFAAGGLVNPGPFVTGTEGSYGYDSRGAYSDVFTSAFQAVASSVIAALQKTAVSAGGIGNYKPGAGVQQWRGVVSQALGLAGSSQQLVDAVLYQMQTESGGNPTIVNTWDSNWLAGHPSVGLMQVIAGTFAAYAGRFRNTGPFEYGVSVNPLANVYSAIKYAQANYGPGLRNAQGGIGSGHGYALGGLVGMAAGGKAKPPPHSFPKAPAKLAFAPWLSQVKAAEAHEKADYAGLMEAFYGSLVHARPGSWIYQNRTGVRERLYAVGKRQSAEVRFFNALLAHATGSAADLAALPNRIGAFDNTVSAELDNLQPGLLGHLPGGHPAQVKALQGQLKALQSLARNKPYNPPWAPGGLGPVHTVLPGILKFDKGGYLPPRSLTMAWNGLSTPEPVGAAAGPVHITLSLDPSFQRGGIDPSLLRAIRATVRTQGGGNVQKALGRP